MMRIQILTRDNEKTIERALKSLAPIEGSIVVGDMGSSDSTLEICSRYGVEIMKLAWRGDYSAARNELADPEGMNMMIEPWEFVAKGHEEISACQTTCSLTVVRGGTASNEIRIWKGVKFKNPG